MLNAAIMFNLNMIAAFSINKKLYSNALAFASANAAFALVFDSPVTAAFALAFDSSAFALAFD